MSFNLNLQRFRWIIYPKFQFTLIGAQILIQITGTVFLAAEIKRHVNHFNNIGHQLGLPLDHSYFQLMNLQSNSLLITLVTVSLFGLVVTTISTIYLSFKLAGPLMRTRRYFERIHRTGKISGTLHFRKDDYLQELPIAINRALEKFQEAKKQERPPYEKVG